MKGLYLNLEIESLTIITGVQPITYQVGYVSGDGVVEQIKIVGDYGTGSFAITGRNILLTVHNCSCIIKYKQTKT